MHQFVRILLFINLIIFSEMGFNASEKDLYEEIKQQDKVFFDAFNACDRDTMGKMFTKELEFYHDISGLGNYESNMEASKNLCERNLGLVRSLVPESLEVYPVRDFGAMQVGKHTFCHERDGIQDCGTFGFLHVWKKTESGWKIHRVMSYGH